MVVCSTQLRDTAYNNLRIDNKGLSYGLSLNN